ncbi:Protein TIF31-like protein [Verticillium dahliae VDG1]|nr:Protein TIF31-like protein [Verticillium dahliae VDG1]
MKSWTIVLVATGLASALSIPRPIDARADFSIAIQQAGAAQPAAGKAIAPAAGQAGEGEGEAPANNNDGENGQGGRGGKNNDDDNNNNNNDIIDEILGGGGQGRGDRKGQQAALTQAIVQLTQAMGLGGILNLNGLANIGVGQELQLLLQLQQIAQIQSAGFITQVDIVGLLQQNQLFGGRGGIFKRQEEVLVSKA